MERKLFYVVLIALVSLALLGSSCQSTPPNQNTSNTSNTSGGGNTTPTNIGTPATNPTAAYIALFEAVKKKDTEAIKSHMSKQTLELANFMSQTYKKPLEKVLENGMSESTMQPALPQLQNEKINSEKGTATLDVKKANGQWEQVPFVNEDGSWKLAYGEVLKGTMGITQPGAENPTINQPAPNAPNPATRQKNVPPLSQPPQKDQKPK